MRKVLHLRSKQLDGQNPKLPRPDQLLHGELAINYLADHETLSIKNSRDEVVSFGMGCCKKLGEQITQLQTQIASLQQRLATAEAKADKYIVRGQFEENNTVVRLFYNDNSSFVFRQGDRPVVTVNLTIDDTKINVSPSKTPNMGERVTLTPKEQPGKRFVKYVDSVVGDVTNATYTFTANEDRTVTAVFEDIPESGSIWSGFKEATRRDDYATEANLVLDQSNVEGTPAYLENKQLQGSKFGFWIFGISKSLQPTISDVQLEANGTFYTMTKDSYEIVDGGDRWVIKDKDFERTTAPVRIKLLP